MVIIECLVNSNGDAQVIVYCEAGGSSIELFRFVMTCICSVIDIEDAR